MPAQILLLELYLLNKLHSCIPYCLFRNFTGLLVSAYSLKASLSDFLLIDLNCCLVYVWLGATGTEIVF